MYHGKTNKPRALKDLLGKRFDPAEMGPAVKRGMVLKIYKAKLLEVIGCKPKTVYVCEGVVPFVWDMKPDALQVKACKVIDKSGLSDRQKHRSRSLLDALQSARLVPQTGPGFERPTLVIYTKPGSPWATDLHHRRYQVMMKINERLKSDFLKEVIIK